MKRALSKRQGFFGVLYLCGADVLLSKRATRETPYRHPCKCSKLRSSDPTCHRCSCVPCAAARAAWAARVQKNKKARAHVEG